MHIPSWLIKVLSGAAIAFVVFFMMQIPWEELVFAGLQLFAVVAALAAGIGLIGEGTLAAFNSSLTGFAHWAGEAIKRRVEALRASNAAPAPTPSP